MRASISASLIPLFDKSDLSYFSDKKSEVRMNAVEPFSFIRKMKNRSGSLPLTLATPHRLLVMTNLKFKQSAGSTYMGWALAGAPHR